MERGQARVADGAIREENRLPHRCCIRDPRDDKCRRYQNIVIGRLVFRLDQRLVGSMILADHGNVHARRAARLASNGVDLGGGCMLYFESAGRTMVVTGALYRYMTIGPKTKDKRRRLACRQTKMSQHGYD